MERKRELLFSLKILEIVHQERRGQVKTKVMEHFNGILFHKSGPGNTDDAVQGSNTASSSAQGIHDDSERVMVIIHVRAEHELPFAC